MNLNIKLPTANQKKNLTKNQQLQSMYKILYANVKVPQIAFGALDSE